MVLTSVKTYTAGIHYCIVILKFSLQVYTSCVSLYVSTKYVCGRKHNSAGLSCCLHYELDLNFPFRWFLQQ